MIYLQLSYVDTKRKDSHLVNMEVEERELLTMTTDQLCERVKPALSFLMSEVHKARVEPQLPPCYIPPSQRT